MANGQEDIIELLRKNAGLTSKPNIFAAAADALTALRARVEELKRALEEHLAAHEKIARDAQCTRCGCFSCDSFREVIAAAKEAGL